MTTSATRMHNWFWPALFCFVGVFNLIDYFYKFSFQPNDLLKGVGFLLLVPLAYLYPGYPYATEKTARMLPEPLAKWLSRIGLALVIAGFAIQWL